MVARRKAAPGATEGATPVLDAPLPGLARLAPDITPDLARAAIGSLTVLGALQAPPAIKAALKDRIT